MTEREPEARAHRILVVDDDPETAGLVRTWYAGKPVEVFDASDGTIGLRLAVEKRPHLILLDLRMPGLDGISMARELKADPRTRAIPVIMLSACRNVESKVDGFAAGVDDYVTKPFEFAEIDARIRAMLRKHEFLAGLQSQVSHLTTDNEQLEQLLQTDDKTGLFNFRAFQRRLTDEWQRAERYGVALSLVFLDLDWFKSVNDTLGHQAGDRVLKEFATLVAGGARASDLAARYGGEEFAVILPHTDGAMAMRVAERIRSAVAEFVFLADETPTRITVSAGVATYPTSTDVDSVDALVRAADRALYLAKDLGRNRVIQDGTAPPTAASTPGNDVKPAGS